MPDGRAQRIPVMRTDAMLPIDFTCIASTHLQHLPACAHTARRSHSHPLLRPLRDGNLVEGPPLEETSLLADIDEQTSAHVVSAVVRQGHVYRSEPTA